jgi:hypothetical protein
VAQCIPAAVCGCLRCKGCRGSTDRCRRSDGPLFAYPLPASFFPGAPRPVLLGASTIAGTGCASGVTLASQRTGWRLYKGQGGRISAADSSVPASQN